MMRRTTHWYSRFGFEEPFPWLAITICAIPMAIIVFAIILGIVLYQ